MQPKSVKLKLSTLLSVCQSRIA